VCSLLFSSIKMGPLYVVLRVCQCYRKAGRINNSVSRSGTQLVHIYTLSDCAFVLCMVCFIPCSFLLLASPRFLGDQSH
jgi:hypothetical protein